MAIASRRALAACCALGALAGCAAPPPRAPALPPSPVAATHGADSSSDWRRLPLAPFGSLLQDLQVPLHEVLMFGELANQECYGLDSPQGPFLGRPIEAYLVCFVKGRLDRVEVTVSLPTADATADFSRYCDAWQAGTVALNPRTDASCSGTVTQGASFSAALVQPPADAEPQSAVGLSIAISDRPIPDSP